MINGFLAKDKWQQVPDFDLLYHKYQSYLGSVHICIWQSCHNSGQPQKVWSSVAIYYQTGRLKQATVGQTRSFNSLIPLLEELKWDVSDVSVEYNKSINNDSNSKL